jgi:hypothetical protein
VSEEQQATSRKFSGYVEDPRIRYGIALRSYFYVGANFPNTDGSLSEIEILFRRTVMGSVAEDVSKRYFVGCQINEWISEGKSLTEIEKLSFWFMVSRCVWVLEELKSNSNFVDQNRSELGLPKEYKVDPIEFVWNFMQNLAAANDDLGFTDETDTKESRNGESILPTKNGMLEPLRSLLTQARNNDTRVLAQINNLGIAIDNCVGALNIFYNEGQTRSYRQQPIDMGLNFENRYIELVEARRQLEYETNQLRQNPSIPESSLNEIDRFYNIMLRAEENIATRASVMVSCNEAAKIQEVITFEEKIREILDNSDSETFMRDYRRLILETTRLLDGPTLKELDRLLSLGQEERVCSILLLANKHSRNSLGGKSFCTENPNLSAGSHMLLDDEKIKTAVKCFVLLEKNNIKLGDRINLNKTTFAESSELKGLRIELENVKEQIIYYNDYIKNVSPEEKQRIESGYLALLNNRVENLEQQIKIKVEIQITDELPEKNRLKQVMQHVQHLYRPIATELGSGKSSIPQGLIDKSQLEKLDALVSERRQLLIMVEQQADIFDSCISNFPYSINETIETNGHISILLSRISKIEQKITKQEDLPEQENRNLACEEINLLLRRIEELFDIRKDIKFFPNFIKAIRQKGEITKEIDALQTRFYRVSTTLSKSLGQDKSCLETKSLAREETR